METNDTLVFTPAGVLELLTQINELDDYDIGLYETPSGMKLHIGDSCYDLPTSDATDISIESSAVEILDAVNDIAFDNIDKSVGLERVDNDTIESGLLKEIAKTLLLGGMVRLSKKILSD